MERENKRLRIRIDGTEETLRENEIKFRLLFEKSVDPVLLMDGDIFIAANPVALDMLRCTDKDLVLGLRPSQISPELQSDGQRSDVKEKMLLSLAQKDKFTRFEWVHSAFDGTYFLAEVSITAIPAKERLITYVVWRDITEKSGMEQALRRAEEKYRSIFENILNGVFQTAPDGRFIAVNPAFAAMHGFASPLEMLTTITNIENQYVDLLDEKKLKRILEDKGSVSKFETQLYRRDKSRIWVSMNVRTVRDDDGSIVYYEGFVEDITQRKMAEESLRKERETFFTILNNDPVGVILSDRGGTYVYMNREFTNITGYAREDVPTGKDWFQKAYRNREYRHLVLDIWKRNASSEAGEWIDAEFTIICKDGGAKDIEFRSTFLKDYSITVLKDVTKRKQAENALHESEEKFRLLFEKSADAILLLDGNRFMDCNEAALKLMRCASKDQLIGLRPFDISAKMQPDGPLSLDKARNAVNVALRDGSSHFEWMLRGFDDEEFLVDVSFTVIRIHGRQILYTVWKNITKRKLAEDALKQTEEKYRNIFENATEGIFQTSIDGRVLSANPAFATLFGYDSPEEMLRTVEDVTYEIYADPTRRKELKRLLNKDGHIRNFEIQCRRKDGEKTWISTNMRVVRDCNDTILFYEGTLFDITERKKIQEDLENESKSLEEANAALKVLLKHREQDKFELEEKVVSNIKELILPYVERLKASKDQGDEAMADIIETNLIEIMSPFIRRMASRYANFTPKEIQIADLIKKGKTTKEMSQLLLLSTRTIDIHRYNIRRKLNLNKQKVNLQTYLLSLS
ncbi:MAG: PAS domain S-box protein [Syntrophobacterales bacterium]|jgi:PAS domain S-box-containing protein|nr:PAS domain S-box protein [Syntrophobacterales bacterium]